MTDPNGRNTWFYHDLSDRLTRTVLPDSSEVLFTYDQNGNMLSLTPPSKPAHIFDYSKVDLETIYTPPYAPTGQADDSARATAKIYNMDKEITRIARPDSLNMDFIYGGVNSLAGQPKRISYDRGTMTFLYDTIKGLVTGVISPIGDSLLYQYDGQLPKNVRWTGSVNGNIKVRYNNDMKVLSETVNNTDSVVFSYDNDGLLKSAGSLKLRSSSDNTLLLSDTLDNVITSYTYTPYGEIVGQQTVFGTDTLFKVGYSRDSLGRISEKTETVQSVSVKYNYVYDVKGQLVQVSKNDTIVSTYTYDANGNRLAHITPAQTDSGAYDTQDRLLSYGNAQYFYSQNGDLKKKIEGTDTTQYDYDAMGNLLSVVLPNGSHVEYITDGAGRRIMRIIYPDSVGASGQITNRWLYSDELRISAELDSAGNVVSHFVYATKQNVPEYIIKDNVVYRIISDQLGSVRQVVNTQTGATVQQMDYDEFGNVISDSNPYFQPFSYAGGLYDSQTKLVRFGARDYDATSGRWTIKDALLFGSGSMNHYVYTGNNPINMFDVRGTQTINTAQALSAFSCMASLTSLIMDIIEVWNSMGRDLWRNDPEGGSKAGLAFGIYSDLWGVWGGATNFAKATRGYENVKDVRSDPLTAFIEKLGANENAANLTEALIAGATAAAGAHTLDMISKGYTFRAIVWSMSFTSAVIAGGSAWINAEMNLGK